MLKVILSFCCVLSLQFGYAQLTDPNVYLSSLKLVPATPLAAQFQKYGDIPVDYQTGVPSIQIPIYTIKMYQFEWPVSLSYHSGGFKVTEVASEAGLGWTLNAGGIISSRVFGLPDIDKPNDLNDPMLKDLALLLPVYTPVNLAESFCTDINPDYENFAANDINGGWNHLPDLFYYNFGGINGKMFLKNGKGHTLPASNLKIIYNNAEWQVTDEKGNKYYFKSLGFNQTSSACNISSPALLTTNKNFVLYKIITYNNETIDFNYTTYNYQYTASKSYTTNVKDNSDPALLTPCSAYTPPTHQTCDNIFSAREARLDEIVTSNGCRIRFAYNSRDDLSGGQKLDSIKVETTSGEIAKWVSLQTDYFGTTNDQNLRLKLDSIHDLDRNGQVVSKTRFYYNSEVLPERLSNAQDSAGYFNGHTENTSTIPHSSDRSFSETYTKACILEKIQFPTGGYSLFDYEINSGGLGGLRIKKVESKTDDVSPAVIKQYIYGDYLSPSTTFEEHVPVYVDYTTPAGGAYTNHEPTECYYYKYTSDGYQNLQDRYRNNSILYYQVSELHGQDGINGKNEYRYEKPVFYTATDLGPANLVETNTYSREGSGYRLLKKTTSTYAYDIDTTALDFADSSTNPLEARIYGIEFKKIREQTGVPVGGCTMPNFCLTLCLDNAYEWSHILLVSLPLRLLEDEERLYANENGSFKDSVCIKHTYSYSISLLSPTNIVTTRSDAQSKEVQTWYPSQKSQIPGLSAGQKTALDSLVVNNIKAQGVYSETKVGTELTGKSQVIYELTNNKSLISKVRQAPSGGTDWIEAEIVSYDANGKILEVKEPSGLYTRFIYDDLYDNVLAQTKHGAPIISAFTSFEPDAIGNWSIGSTLRITDDAITGKQCYQLLSGAISKSGLSTSDSYTLSYWTKNGSPFTISGTQGAPVQGRSVNGWTCFTHTISGVSQISLSGTGLIDELRLYPQNAQIITYTYDPLIGITAQCDAANKITYYEYEDFGRLKIIRDMDGNIIKTMEYHFKGQ